MATSTILAGISFPFRLLGTGLPAPAFGTEVIRSALIVLLRTARGSRVMRPDLGNDLQHMIFEIQGPALQALMTREILNTIADNLPQVVVTNFNFTETEHEIQVNVSYNVQGVQDQTGFVTVATKG